MAAAIQRSDSQRLQTNGPRVSFNRDVHVKRIAPRPKESPNYKAEPSTFHQPTVPNLRRKHTNLSEEAIRKEAAIVLAQAERIKCRTEEADKSPFQKSHKQSIPNKFHSLPLRKKKPLDKSAVSRSVSDASSKKSKKPSIFSIFSRKSDTNLSLEQRPSRFAESGGRRLVRSKSDAGSYKESKSPKKRNGDRDEQGPGSTKLPPSQLSPIIENAQKEDYFEELFDRERRKSEAITAEEKHATALNDFLAKYNVGQGSSGNIAYTNEEDLHIVPSQATAETSPALHDNQSKSIEDMHSSQLPPEKPTLTKGVTVNGIVKRLSMERFTPPPTISGPVFSYTRPSEQVIYAQLAADEEKSLRRPTVVRSPFRVTPNGNPSSDSFDTIDYPSSHRMTSKVITESKSHAIHSPTRESLSPSSGPTMIRIQHSHSPWQQINPRNLSDEDEGLGIETRKSYDDDYQHNFFERNKSVLERPIVPNNTRCRSPIHNYHHESAEEMNTLSRRRAVLESRIQSRRIPAPEAVTIEYCVSPERNRVRAEFREQNGRQYISPDRDDYSRFHKLKSDEIINKYSPERSHLDMVSPSGRTNGQHNSHYIHTKFYDSGTGGIREIYERESRVDDHGRPIIHEIRRKERISSPTRPTDSNFNLVDYEPRNSDVHYPYRSSPENLKHLSTVSQSTSLETEYLRDGLNRDKRQQRSFDKGDSGIENDFRKESFNGDISSRWRKRTYKDDINACELFIKKERRHTEAQHPQRKKYDFVYRERSIDDGSHYDPRLDKYPKTSTSTLRRNGKESVAVSTSQPQFDDTLKRTKKVGGFQKVKQLFSSGRKKDSDSKAAINGKGEMLTQDSVKDKYPTKDDEVHSKYREQRASQPRDSHESKTIPDISLRRRLSTPKSSPTLKRTSSEAQRKKSPLTVKNSTDVKSEKTSWFKSIERKSKSKSKERLNPTVRGDNETSQNWKRNTYRGQVAPAPPIPPKNFRFFGDTDLDSNPPTISRVTTTSRSRPAVSTLNRSQKYSRSAYDLDRINHVPPKSASSRVRSSSLQNLDDNGVDEIDSRKRRHYSRSRNLDDISESGSETEDQYKRQTIINSGRSLSRDKLDRAHRYDDRSSHERFLTTSTGTLKRNSEHATSTDSYRQAVKPPPKPARINDRRFNQGDSDRLPDSSGTEGESNMHQRNVVYLHATTVGAIPQVYNSRRRAESREDLRKNKTQPMSRSVSRSVSMLAPWKPKQPNDEYEINYSQDQNEQDKKLGPPPRKGSHSNTSTSTLSRNKKTETQSRSRRTTSMSRSKDDLSSNRNSSSTSAPKSSMSSTMDARKGTARRK